MCVCACLCVHVCVDMRVYTWTAMLTCLTVQVGLENRVIDLDHSCPLGFLTAWDTATQET